MNREEMPRIRLKVATNAGINILCTALRRWKVADWLPHIEQAYREVKQEQGEDEHSKQRFIKAIRIKKGQFYIANSEIIGDVFQDNDEVQCEIVFPNSKKTKSKQVKLNKKQQEHINTLNVQHVEEQEGSNSQEIEQKEGQVSHHNDAEPVPTKKQKIQQAVHQHHQINGQISTNIQPSSIGNKLILNNPQSKKSKPQPTQSKPEKKQILQTIDISKLKKLIIKSEKKPQPSPSKHPHPHPNSPLQ